MINLKIRGMEELKAKLDSVPYGARGDATEAGAHDFVLYPAHRRSQLFHPESSSPDPRGRFVGIVDLRSI
jgi:hypothetical protein